MCELLNLLLLLTHFMRSLTGTDMVEGMSKSAGQSISKKNDKDKESKSL